MEDGNATKYMVFQIYWINEKSLVFFGIKKIDKFFIRWKCDEIYRISNLVDKRRNLLLSSILKKYW